MNLKEFCLNLAYSDTEDDVIEMLRDEHYWDDPDCWEYYGQNENNFATIGNQQSRPEAAVVEKIINAVDAVLMGECMATGIKAESPKAPQSIRDALIRFFEIYDGRLSNITPNERLKLSQNIWLVATGKKNSPCYSVIDKGEGQTVNKMPETLLSLAKSNKLRIPFVQGKFNMGGTGVFRFCGRHNLQLVISKRYPKVAKSEKDESRDKWGFTIVRREDPSHGVRSSTYRYLAPFGKILSFESNGLKLLPGKYPDPYGEILEWGTFIKLYEYQMVGLKTALYYDLYYRLSLLMPNIALPVRFAERRKGYSAHSYEITMSGLSVRLDEDKYENLEQGFPTSTTLSALGQKMKASIYAFKRDKSKRYTNNEGIIFTVNGQTHAHLLNTFFSRTAVGLGYLANSLLVSIDCTEFDGRSKEDLFMNSRDRLCSGELRSKIERNLEDLLKNHQGLRILKQQRRKEDIENKLEDSKPLADVIESILKKSPTLSKLFVHGVRLPNPFQVDIGKAQKDFEGKQFPTYFTLMKNYPIEKPKNCPSNSRFRIQYKTDASNDYFSRDSDPGSFGLIVNEVEIADFSLNLWNGIANLNVHLPHNINTNAIVQFKSDVIDINHIEPLTDEFFVMVLDATEKHPTTSNKTERKPPSSKDKGMDVEKTDFLDLPNVIEVREGEWDKHSFTKESALRVISSGEEGYDFFVNMDNVHLLTEQKAGVKIDSKLLDARYKYGMVLIGIALLKDFEASSDETNGEEKDIFSKIDYVTKAVSPILLPMIDSLGDLEVDETKQVFTAS